MTPIAIPILSILRITLAVGIGAIVLLLLTGFLYQFIGGMIDRRRLSAGGRMVDIGRGQRLYVVERGSATHNPAVIFEAGFGATSLNWIHIQEALAAQVHTVAYDRCGLGWSSASISERTPTHVAAELREMLLAAGIQPPWVLVGHSYGGLVMRRFALDYPDETAGAVLLDPMRTEEWPPVNAKAHAEITRALHLTRMGEWFARLGLARLAIRSHLCRSGRLSGLLIRLAGRQGLHLAGRLDGEIGKMPPSIRPSIAAHWSTPRFYRGLHAHLCAVPSTVNEMHDAMPICNVPVIVITPASASPVSDLRKFGPHSREIFAEQSRHWVHLDEPELVVQTILDMVEQARDSELAHQAPAMAGVRA